MHKITGKSFNPKYENHIKEKEVHQELTWLLEHFKILTKEDVNLIQLNFNLLISLHFCSGSLAMCLYQRHTLQGHL